MAEVPYSGTPSVGPNSAPTPFQNISAPAGAFGPNVVGAGLQDVAKAAGVTSEALAAHAAQSQALTNKSISDQAYVQSLSATDAYANDFKSNNMGFKASENLGKAFGDLEGIRAQAGADLNPTARAMFDADTRRMLAYTQSSLTAFASSEHKRAQVDGFKAKVDALSSDSILHPENFTANLQQQGAAWAAQDQALGVAPEVGAQQMAVRVGGEVQKVAMGMAGMGHPDAALAFVEQHKEAMDGGVYAETLKQLHPAVEANAIAGIGQSAANYATAQVGGGGSRPARNNNPLNLTNLPSGQWSGQTGRDGSFAQFATPEDGWKAADRNLQSYGREGVSTLSAIITKWAPPSENDTASYIRTVAHDTGLDPNAHLDLHDPTVRQQVLTAMSKVEGGSASGRPSAGDTINGTPSSYELMAQMGNARAFAAKQVADQGGDALTQQRAADSAETELRRRAEAAKANENQSFQTLASVVENSNIQDKAHMFSVVPNGVEIYNALPLAQRNALDNALKHNANDLTPARELQVERLAGMYGTRNVDGAFASADISSMDLPLAAKNQWMLRQAQFKGQQQRTADEGNQLTQMIHDPRVAPTLKALQLSGNADHYYQFLGALDSELKSEEGPGPAKLNDGQKMTAFNKAVAKVASTSAPLSIGPVVLGGPTLQWKGPSGLTPQVRTQITTLLTSRGIVPNEYNITRQFYAGRTPLEY